VENTVTLSTYYKFSFKRFLYGNGVPASSVAIMDCAYMDSLNLILLTVIVHARGSIATVNSSVSVRPKINSIYFIFFHS